MKELQRQAPDSIVIALAGNKLDLVTADPSKRAVPTADAESYAREARLLFFETSAKNATNVKELFTAIARRLPLDRAGPRGLNRGAGGAGGVGRGAGAGVDLRSENASTQSGSGCAC